MERSSQYRWLRLTALLCFLSGAFWPTTELAAQIQKVRISISSRSNTSVPYYVAVSKGFFREEGIDVPAPRCDGADKVGKVILSERLSR